MSPPVKWGPPCLPVVVGGQGAGRAVLVRGAVMSPCPVPRPPSHAKYKTRAIHGRRRAWLPLTFGASPRGCGWDSVTAHGPRKGGLVGVVLTGVARLSCCSLLDTARVGDVLGPATRSPSGGGFLALLAAMHPGPSPRTSAWGTQVFHRTRLGRLRPTEAGAWQGCCPQGPGLAQTRVGTDHDSQVGPLPGHIPGSVGSLELSPPTLLSPSEPVRWVGEEHPGGQFREP